MRNRLLLEIDGLAKQYGRRQLFGDLSLRLAAGERLAVTGPNGAGKSTLLRIIAGLERPTRGSVRMYDGDKPLAKEEQVADAGLVSPEMVVYNAMTGLENLRFFADLQGQAMTTDWLTSCLDKVGLAARRADYVGSYSTGMRQRLKIALLLAMNRRLWLLDEPSSNLDDGGKLLVAELTGEAVRRGHIVVVATNEPEEAAHADQRIVLA